MRNRQNSMFRDLFRSFVWLSLIVHKVYEACCHLSCFLSDSSIVQESAEPQGWPWCSNRKCTSVVDYSSFMVKWSSSVFTHVITWLASFHIIYCMMIHFYSVPKQLTSARDKKHHSVKCSGIGHLIASVCVFVCLSALWKVNGLSSQHQSR